MTSRNWVKLFMSTLLIGGATTAAVGFVVRWAEFKSLFIEVDLIEIISILIWLFGFGLIFSVISQMGFFAYLTVHRFGLGIFKSATLWNWVQIILIAFVLFDLVYLRYNAFAEADETILNYLWPAFFVLLVGIIVATIKMKETNKGAFIPALFFMIVVTTIEWVPVLRVNDQIWLYLMLLPLLACNAYQILILHKLNEQSQIQRNTIKQSRSN